MNSPIVPILIGKNWTEPEVSSFTPVHNPCKGEVIARTPHCSALDVDLAVRVAQEAFSSWGTKPALERARVLFKYRELLVSHDTHDGGAARKFARQVECGMVGVNLGVPAPMAQFSFSGWDQSFYGDLHVQGTEGILFYTRQKTVLTRWGRVGGAWFGSRT